MLHSVEPPAIVAKADTVETRSVPRHWDPDVRDLQKRAETFVAEHSDHEVEMYELERALQREEWGLPPVPVTDKGLKVLTAKQYAVTDEGFLIL